MPAVSTSTGSADDKVLLPILGGRSTRCWPRASSCATAMRFRYFSHRLRAVAGEPRAPALAPGWWRSAGDRINWRRFFDINELVCLRMEEPRPSRPSSADRCACTRRACRRPARRPCRRPGRSGRLLPHAARSGSTDEPGAALSRGREDPAGRRDPAGRLGLRRHHRLRLHGRGQRPAARPGRRAGAGRGLGGAERPAGRFRGRGGARAPRDSGAQLSAPSSTPASAPSPGRRRADRPAGAAPRAGRAAGAFSGLSHLWHGGGGRRRSSRARQAAAARDDDLPADRPLGDRSGCCAGCASPIAAAPSRASSN